MYSIYKLNDSLDLAKLHVALTESNYIYPMFQRDTISLEELYNRLKGKLVYVATENNSIIAFIIFEYPYLNLVHTHCCFLGHKYSPGDKASIFKDILVSFYKDYNLNSFIGYVPYPFKKTVLFWKEYCNDWSTVIGEVPSGLIYNNEDVGGYIFHVQLDKES